ncbi:DEAD/DEAH box helicase [Anatilimnocola floriformis]|uniref:DEAD/DEAH box helicase n=1 Tax=Anatilimnocola floriformis TaxID=2948575 RepID=UPI0020C55982|nr:DEAD/DEAH box helicase [Anatilimnocola floriformis]
MLLAEMLEDLRDLEIEHAESGVFGPTAGVLLTPFHFNENWGLLSCSAGGHTCRIAIYFTSENIDDDLVPARIDRLGGTCQQHRRHQACVHSLAAIRELSRTLKEVNSPLRKKLYGLGAVPNPKEAWKNALLLVDDYLAVQQTVETASEPDTRIAWRVEFSKSLNYGPQLSIDPYEQRVGKGGNWTKGRRIRLEDFAQMEEAWSQAADRQVANFYSQLYTSRRSAYSYYSGPTIKPYDLLEALMGHPLLTWSDAPQQVVEIVRGDFGLAVQEVEGGWKIIPSINGATPAGDAVWGKEGQNFEKPMWIDRDANRIVLGAGDTKAVTLAARLAMVPQAIPAEGQSQLLARLTLLQNRMPVTLPAGYVGGTEAADDRLVLRLTPHQGGVLAEMVVIPVAERQAYFPGEGPAALTQLKEGKQFCFERKLPEERRRAAECVESLRLGMHVSPRPWQWQLPSHDDALDLLALLADRPREDLVVQWPAGAERKVSATLQASALRVQIESQHDWFGLNGTVQIEGEEVELAKILHAMRKGSRYVEVSPNQFVRFAQTLRQSLEALDEVAHETKSGKLEFDITAAPVLQKMCDPSVELKTCLAWEESLTKLRTAEELRPELPVTLAAELRDYQLEGFQWLSRLAAWGMGGCLADDMGLGKTVQTLALLITRAEEGPALVIAPTSVGFNWIRETQRFAPTLRAVLYRETDRDEILQNLAAGDVLVVSYGLLQRDVERLAKVKWNTLVLDEAQRVKNAVTKTAQAVRQIEANWRLALTGTPVENHLGELWSIFRAVCPGLLGSWERFRTKFADSIEKQKDPVRRRALSRLMRPFILRRTKSEVLEELPARTEIIRTAEMTKEETQRYHAARLDAIANLAGAGESEKDGVADRRFEVLAALTRLRQLACHPKLVDAAWPGDSAKLELFMEIVEELREGNHRALVFSQFVQHLELIRAALDAAGITYQYLDGQTPAKEREKRVDAFQRGEGEMFLISLKAGGTGLNLTAADYVIHMDPWWNPAVEDQATDRAHRIGQTRPVTVYRLVTKDTIEEQILAMHAGKRNLVADILEGTDQAGKLSTRELVDLIRTEGKAAITSEAAEPPKNTKTAKRKTAKR